MLDVEHYVTLTGIDNDRLLMFDPYFYDGRFEDSAIQTTLEHPFSYNRVLPSSILEREDDALYSLGKMENREAVLIFNKEITLTAENTIEYFI